MHLGIIEIKGLAFELGRVLLFSYLTEFTDVYFVDIVIMFELPLLEFCRRVSSFWSGFIRHSAIVLTSSITAGFVASQAGRARHEPHGVVHGI